MTDFLQRLSRPAVFAGLFLAASHALSYDTAGVDASPLNFNQPNLTEMRWKAAVSEYDLASLRIEFNLVEFENVQMGVMLQNLLHMYGDAACSSNTVPGLEFYFSVIDDFVYKTNPPLVAGIQLDADPNAYPLFRRVFENIDYTGHVGNNVYSNEAMAVASPSAPGVLQWHLVRGNAVVNPAGNLKKDIYCNWVALNGTFRQWSFDVTVNGVNYPVATYYLPDTYAPYLHSTLPFVFHQEYFGACNDHLDQAKGDVRYYGMEVRQGGSTVWIPINDWQLNYDYGGECGAGVPSDLRHGLGTSMWTPPGSTAPIKVILSRVGHANDISMKRCSVEDGVGYPNCNSLTALSTTLTGSEVTISNVVVTGSSTSPTIAWTTSRTADGMIRYGKTADYGTDSAWLSVPSTSHSITLSALQGPFNYFRIESIDADGHMAAYSGRDLIFSNSFEQN